MRDCKHGQRMGGGVARHTKAQAEQTREAILDAAEKDERFSRVVTTLVGRIGRPQDLAAFEGWEAPRPDGAAPPAAPDPDPA